MRARRTQGLAALIALLVMSASPRTQSGDAAQAAVAPEPPKLAEYLDQLGIEYPTLRQTRD